MQRVMGLLPGQEKTVPLDVKVVHEETASSYTRRRVSYASVPGERVPAWLLIPNQINGRAPAMLVLHQTTQLGKDEAVGLGGNLDLKLGAELAERGYVVLAPDYPTLGEHNVDVYAQGWKSASMKAIWDNMRGIDLLESLKEVDGKRIGAIGHSLGGHNALFTAAFDTRIKCVVTNCGFTSFKRYYGGNLKGWWGPRYMPKIETDFPTPDKMPFDFDDVLTAIAPRAVYVSAPVHDTNFDNQGVREVVEKVKPVYHARHADDKLTAVYPEYGHEWHTADREVAYSWLDRMFHHNAPGRALNTGAGH